MESIEVEYLAADELKAIELAMAQAEASHARASPTSRSTAPQPQQQPRQPTTSAAQLPVGLPDYLDYDLDIIFVGDNPGRNQKWYAHATNHFWPLLHDAGFLPTPLTHLDDHMVTQHKVGLTCLCSRATRGTDELAREELTDGLRLLEAKLEQYRPKAICFNGVGIYEATVTGGAKARVGYQGDDKIVPGVSVFVMPSARVKVYSYEQKVNILRDVKKHIDAKRRSSVQ